MTMPNIEELMALADRYATLRIGEGTANARKELHDAMQSQAERIKELEGRLDDATAAARTEQMIAETAQAAASRLLTERDALRAQLSEIAATEPVARTVADTTNTGHSYVKVLVNELPFRTELFTRPMPQIIGLQDVHDAVTADPTLADCAQDVNAELVEALQCAKNSLVAFKLMPVPSNAWEDPDEANLEVVNAALSKYKGAK